MSSRLTLNLGIRWDTMSPSYEIRDRQVNFDPYITSPIAGTGDIPAGATGIMQFQNRDGNGKYLWRWDKKNFAPRFGFAWRPFGDNKTVIRGGYGLVYGLTWTANTQPPGGGTYGFTTAYSQANPNYRLRDGIPPEAQAFVPQSALTSTYGFTGSPYAMTSILYTDQNEQTPYSQQMNLTIQHQFKDVLFEVGYLGNFCRATLRREKKR